MSGVRPGVWIGMGVALLAYVALSKKQPEPVGRGLVIGDSHSEASWTLGGRLKKLLEERGLTARVVGNRGKGVGWYLSSGKLQQALGSFKPDLMVVALGANDAGQFDELEYKALLVQFVAQAKDAGVQQIIWYGPSKSDGALADRMPARQAIASWQNQTLPGLGVEWHDSMAMTADLPTRDGVHYRSAEYAIWAGRAAEVLFDGVIAA